MDETFQGQLDKLKKDQAQAQWVYGTQTYYYPTYPSYPAPCPGCGRCPVCGRGGYGFTWGVSYHA